MSEEKRLMSVYDNVYGYIKFQRDKFKPILDDPFFTRLHHIKQMGLTHYVFPDALHTRYSHSLGVFFIVHKMIYSQKENYGIDPMGDRDRSLLVMSALLHDVGHLPLSHTIEKALKKYEDEYEAGNDEELFGKDGEKKPKSDTKLHEKLARYVCEHTSLKDKLKGYPIHELANRIEGLIGEDVAESSTTEPKFSLIHGRNFLHSQLDADRIDYLLRDSSFTGVKSGAFDFDKLLDEIRYDGRGKFGVNPEGIRALEQFFMSRFAAYAQIPFNKRVHAFEFMAMDFYYRLLVAKRKYPDVLADVLSYSEIVKMLQSTPEKFLTFTDMYFFNLVDKATRLRSIKNDDPIKMYAKLIQARKPLKVVTHQEAFCTQAEWDGKGTDIQKARANKAALAKAAGVGVDDVIIPEEPMTVKIYDEAKDSIYIFEERAEPVNLLECGKCFLHHLIGKKLFIDRIFTFDEEKQQKIEYALRDQSKWVSK